MRVAVARSGAGVLVVMPSEHARPGSGEAGRVCGREHVYFLEDGHFGQSVTEV